MSRNQNGEPPDDGEQGSLDFECEDAHCEVCPVLDAPRAHRVTEKAVSRSTAHAPSEVFEQASLALVGVAYQQPELTADDVWLAVPRDVMKQWNPSALGGVFRAAAKDGLIELTGEKRESQRPATHRRPLRVWRSRVYQRVS